MKVLIEDVCLPLPVKMVLVRPHKERIALEADGGSFCEPAAGLKRELLTSLSWPVNGRIGGSRRGCCHCCMADSGNRLYTTEGLRGVATAGINCNTGLTVKRPSDGLSQSRMARAP